MEQFWNQFGLLLRGLGPTCLVFFGAVILAMGVAIILGGALTTPWRLLRWPAAVVVESVRGTSAIVQLFWVFFALPMVGITIPALLAGMVVLGVNSGAYGAEVVRGALQAVDRGQRDAAAALSLGPLSTWWRIILPQAVPRMLPPFGNLAVELLKNTALVGLVGIADLTFQSKTLHSNSLNDWLLVETLFLYAALAFVVVRALGYLERHCGRWRAST